MVFLLGIIYLAFISLGLPDALLGAAWPNMYPQFQVPVSYAGAISMIIAFGTIISSLQSDRLTKRFGTGVVTTVSVGITAFALWGFSVSHNFIQLCLWAIPGAKAVMLCFFCYCAVEQTAMLWASSYLNLAKGVAAQTAASFAGLFCIGITVGRGINGFIAMKLKDHQMIRMGQMIIFLGIVVMMLPFGDLFSLIGFSLIGLGCTPVYPCIIHSTPEHFGADRSQAMIGVQMASAYVGICLMPPLFGLIANHISIRLLPVYLLILLAVMVAMHEKLNRCDK